MTNSLVRATCACALLAAAAFSASACGTSMLPIDASADDFAAGGGRAIAGAGASSGGKAGSGARTGTTGTTGTTTSPVSSKPPTTSATPTSPPTGRLPSAGAPANIGIGVAGAPRAVSPVGGAGAVSPPPRQTDGGVTDVSDNACPDGDIPNSVIAVTQHDLDQLRGCKRIRGDVVIAIPDLTDLSALQSLEIVDGKFQIGMIFLVDSQAATIPLKSFEGLSNLRSVGTLELADIAASDLRGFRSLTSARQLLIQNLDLLNDLSGLENLVWTEATITQDDKLQTLKGLGVPKSVESLTLDRDPQLDDLSALANLQAISGLLLNELSGLGRLNGLEGLKEVSGSLAVLSCTELTDLSGLGAISVHGGIQLQGNPVLRSLRGLQVNGHPTVVSIAENAQLEDLTGLVGDQLDGIDGMALRDLPRLASLKGLTGLKALPILIVVQCDALTDLTGLETLTNMSELGIGSCVGLQSLQGLQNLGGIEDTLALDKLPALTGLTALTQLKHVTGQLRLSSLNKLHTLEGLEALTMVGSLSLVESPNLQSLHGLEHLTALTNLALISESTLADVSALAGITQLVDLNATNNSVLTSFQGLSLTMLGSLEVDSNPSLGTLTGLEKVSSRLMHLYIYNNSALTNLQGLMAIQGADEATIVNNSALPECYADRIAQSSGSISVGGNNVSAACPLSTP